MNYLKQYNLLIETRRQLKRKRRKNITGLYLEEHHIIPTCLGGLDKKNNKVLLTWREHYVAHVLLYEIYKDECKEYQISLGWAVWSMCRIDPSKPGRSEIIINSHDLEKARLIFIESISV